jgi:ABC-type phosphate transport system permease subunit
MSNLLYGSILITLLQIMVWVSVNAQFSEYFKDVNTFAVCVLLAVPISISGFFGSKFLYAHFDSAWSIRFVGFGISYLVFPVMTWYLLAESMFTAKTLLCIFLSLCIILIQVFV